MILLSGLLVASSLWAQDSSSNVEDETGKVPVKAYFENGNFHS